MSDWQPISTAPKDGTPFLAWAYLHDDGGPHYEDRRSFMGELPRHHVLYWRNGIGWVGWFDGSVDGPTHWMPLPPTRSGRPQMNGKDFAQDAADRLNAMTINEPWKAAQYGGRHSYPVTVLADTLAELAAVKADMAEIEAKTNVGDLKPKSDFNALAIDALFAIKAIAAKHRPQPDALAEALIAIGLDDGPKLAADLRAELARCGHGGGL